MNGILWMLDHGLGLWPTLEGRAQPLVFSFSSMFSPIFDTVVSWGVFEFIRTEELNSFQEVSENKQNGIEY